jgi:electron transport complex protein RnfG
MKETLKEVLKYSLILSSICLVASGLLAGVYSFTQSRIAAETQAGIDANLKQVLPNVSRFEAVKAEGEILYYKGYSKENKFIGVAFTASAKGYSSIIDTLVGMSASGEITGVKVINQNETPGLGTRVSENSFLSQFVNKNINSLSGVQTVSGATISSRAVIESVRKRIEQIQKILK